MKTTGMFAVCVMVLGLGLTASAAPIDYIAVTKGGPGPYIYAYDTVAKTLTLVAGPVPTALPNALLRMSAGPDGAFWAACDQSSTEGVERFLTTNKTSWSSDFAINMGGTGAGAFFAGGVRSPNAGNTDPIRPGAAELANGKFMAVDGRVQANGHAWAMSTVNSAAWSGIITDAGFAAGSGGYLNVSAASYITVDATSTVAGASNRFVVTDMSNSGIVVYNADGTLKGSLTDLTSYTYASAVGTMKSSGYGDVALILESDRAGGATAHVIGRYVSDVGFDTVAIPQFTVTGPPASLEFSDVDGTQSGLIVVAGSLYDPSRGNLGVRFYKTDGTPDSAWFNLGGGVENLFGSIAGLYFAAQEQPSEGTVPEPAALGLLGLAALALKRRRT